MVMGGHEGYASPSCSTSLRLLRCIIFSGRKSGLGLVSRVTPVHTALRNCTRDEGMSFEVGNQVLISNHRKLLWPKAKVVNFAELLGSRVGSRRVRHFPLKLRSLPISATSGQNSQGFRR
jgi:hypothetical protein